jgi:signal peptidase II
LPEGTTNRLACFALAAAVLLVDQLSKSWASSELLYAVPEPVFFWFNLTLHHNEGAAFSFLSDAGGWQRWFFTVLAAGVSTVLSVWLWTTKAGHFALPLALALVLGGALGNLVDRVQLGYVVDFISLHYNSRYFPTFNVADSAISVGAALLVLDSLRAPKAAASESS